METIAKLQVGTAYLDITLARTNTAVILRIGDDDSRWRAERAVGSAAGADLWRFVQAAAHRIVADYLEEGANSEFAPDAATAVYVQAGSTGVVRAELGNDESVFLTARLLIKVVHRLASREATLFDAAGRKVTVRVAE
jgi:hypothetical protein